jgi:hypothetical protein
VLITKIVDLAIGLGLSLITSYDANDLLCQFGSIRRLTLRIERQGADYQNRKDQQLVHKTHYGLRKATIMSGHQLSTLGCPLPKAKVGKNIQSNQPARRRDQAAICSK